jgi:hypothetical protein
MTRTATRSLTLLLSLAVVAGCSDTRSDSRASVDSLLSRDLTLASTARPDNISLGDTAAATPAAPEVVAPAPAVVRPAVKPPVTPARTPAPATVERPARATISAVDSNAAAADAPPARAAGPLSARRTLGTGTVLAGRTTQEICSLANRPGDRFVATLNADVTGPDGGRLAAGTPILVELSAPSTPDGPFVFVLKAVQVDGELVPVQGSVAWEGTTTERRVAKGGDQGKVVGGAVAGAILGRVLGGGTKGTVIGAAGGAAAGTIAASRNATVERCLPSGSTLTVTLSSPLVLASGAP